MKKDWYKSKAVWGGVLLFVAGGLEALGVSGVLAQVQGLAGLLGLPLAVVGLRHAQG